MKGDYLMQALVIYDSTGNVWNITYGDSALPGNLSSAQLEIPDGTQLTGVDLSNPDIPQPVFKPLPQSSYDELKNEIDELKIAQQDQACERVESDVDMDYRLSVVELGLN